MCWHKLAFYIFSFLCFSCDSLKSRCEGLTMGAMRCYIQEKTRSDIRHATTSKRDGKTHLISDLCYIFFLSLHFCCFVAFRVVHCAHFGCERTYQTLENVQCIRWEGIVTVVESNHTIHIYIRCLLLRSAIKFRTFYKFMCVDWQVCGCCCADVVPSKNNKHSKWQIFRNENTAIEGWFCGSSLARNDTQPKKPTHGITKAKNIQWQRSTHSK